MGGREIPYSSTSELVTGSGGEAQAIIDAARLGQRGQIIDPDHVYVFQDHEGKVQVIDGTDHRDSRPVRKTGSFSVFTGDSFAAYVNEQDQADGETKVWVDENHFTVAAVINGHGVNGAGFGDHRARLILTPTEPWKAWAENDGRLLPQVQFAEFIEDNAADIVNPSPAEMLEIAQSLQANTKVEFESTDLLADGRRALKYKETIDARAGQKGQLSIPVTFDLALKPFLGAEPYRVTARFRYRIDGGNLKIGYKLLRPADVQRTAFGDVVAEIGELLTDTIPVLHGIPA